MKRVALFAAGLAGAFAAAFLAGSALDVKERTVAAASHEMAAAPAGLAVTQDGYGFESSRRSLQAGKPATYDFRITGPDGHVIRDFDVEHERRLHLIVVRRDLGVFLHVHPVQRADGTWTVPLQLPSNGVYRVFADFTVDGERRTLGRDLFGTGASTVLGTPSSIYDVGLARDGDRLTFAVRLGGRRVEPQPYLGARGHLVVLRRGDLAYLHAHADEDRLAFDVPFEQRASYRLFLQFKVDGSVQTVPFSVRG